MHSDAPPAWCNPGAAVPQHNTVADAWRDNPDDSTGHTPAEPGGANTQKPATRRAIAAPALGDAAAVFAPRAVNDTAATYLLAAPALGDAAAAFAPRAVNDTAATCLLAAPALGDAAAAFAPRAVNDPAATRLFAAFKLELFQCRSAEHGAINAPPANAICTVCRLGHGHRILASR